MPTMVVKTWGLDASLYDGVSNLANMKANPLKLQLDSSRNPSKQIFKTNTNYHNTVISRQI